VSEEKNAVIEGITLFEVEEVIPRVETNEANDVGISEATLNGELTDLGEESEVDVFFEHREEGESTWDTTSAQSFSSTQTFDETVAGLTDNTEYEFRAVVEWDDGEERSEGSIETFTTEESNPVFEVTITNTNSPVGQGSTLTVDADIENTGNDEGTKDVWLEYDEEDNEVDREEDLTISDGDTESITLEHSIPSDEEPDDYDIWVKTEDDEDTATITVEELQEIEIDFERPADGAELRSTNARFQFTVTVGEDGVGEDYFVKIFVDDEEEFSDEIEDASEQDYEFDELIEGLETGSKDATIRVEKQED